MMYCFGMITTKIFKQVFSACDPAFVSLLLQHESCKAGFSSIIHVEFMRNEHKFEAQIHSLIKFHYFPGMTRRFFRYIDRLMDIG